MKKNRIRLTEAQLHKVIKESVKKVLRETHYTTSINIEDEIDSLLNTDGLDVDDAEEKLQTLGKLRCVDEKIDDGIDDEECEDEYVMMRLYELHSKDGVFDIRLYYGNNTFEVTYHTVDKIE